LHSKDLLILLLPKPKSPADNIRLELLMLFTFDEEQVGHLINGL